MDDCGGQKSTTALIATGQAILIIEFNDDNNGVSWGDGGCFAEKPLYLWELYCFIIDDIDVFKQNDKETDIYQ